MKSDDLEMPLTSVPMLEATLFLEGRLGCDPPIGTGATSEKDRDLGIDRTTVGELGEGELLRLPTGLDPGVPSRLWRKLELRILHGSSSSVGMPVADVVVVHVLVDILRIRLGGKLRLDFYNNKKKQIKIFNNFWTHKWYHRKRQNSINNKTSLPVHILIHNELAIHKTKKKQVTYIDIKIVLNILKYVEICKH